MSSSLPSPLHQHQVFDVVVVGAGLSGLHAAYLLQMAGLSTLVLEARNREFGAAWINDSTQDRIWKLANELRITSLVQVSEVKAVAQDVDGTCIDFMYGGAPVQYDGSVQAQATGKVWTHALIGCDPREVSALFVLDYIHAAGGLMQIRSDKRHGGQYMRITEGTSAFGERVALLLNPGTLKLSSPVDSIVERPDLSLTQITTARVIMTAPSPVYRTITFSPPLSPAKPTYVNATHYGSYTRYLVFFKVPFWRKDGYCGLAQSFVGPVSVFRDTSREEYDGQNSCLTCLSALEKQSAVLQQISQIFAGGKDVTMWFIEALESPWMSEQYSGWGSPIAVLAPGEFGKYWDAFVASERSLHFIGNETATRWRGYMDGAIRTAERGAAEVIAALRKERALL
ncbi:FAD/NAD(P)-binding domain-containing protein [Cadophora sp. DSE1049]|nr:FAD/NAD(P)-binding domain-containing protein [Cadophora sp. DSE1049]